MADSTATTKHIGDLIVTKKNAASVAYITEVTGYLSIEADAQLPVLTSVGGGLSIEADAQLPVLTSVGGGLYIEADAQLPVLTSVGGSLYIRADAQLPVLTSVGGGLYIEADAKLPVLTSVGGYLFIAIGVSFDHSSIEFGAGRVLAVHEYALHIKDGEYRAGCRGPWTAQKALRHWNTWHHAPTRAEKFRAAIAAQEGSHE